MSNHPFDPQTPPQRVPPSQYVPPTDYAVPTQYVPAPQHIPEPVDQGAYPPPYASPYAPVPEGYQQQTSEGSKFATFSMVSGIVGLFFWSFLFGPLALYLASRASNLGATPTAGKVLGWIATGFGVIQVLFFVVSLLQSSY